MTGDERVLADNMVLALVGGVIGFLFLFRLFKRVREQQDVDFTSRLLVGIILVAIPGYMMLHRLYWGVGRGAEVLGLDTWDWFKAHADYLGFCVMSIAWGYIAHASGMFMHFLGGIHPWLERNSFAVLGAFPVGILLVGGYGLRLFV